MKLSELSIAEYGKLLASDAPAPGGGSASALCGMQGAALTAMVANLTLGRKKYTEYQDLCKEKAATCTAMVMQFAGLIEKDTAAFMELSAAMKLPRETEEEKCLRKAAIAQATLFATEVPLETMELGLRVLQETQQLIGKSNANAASDLGVAALNLLSCIRGAWLNVKINLPGIQEENRKEAFASRGEEICAQAQQLCDKIYTVVLESL